MRTSFYAIIILLVSFILFSHQSYAQGVAPITGSSTVCSGSLTTLADSTTGGTWSSSSLSIATVNSVGIVTGVSAGVVIITYTYSSFTATHTMTVMAAPTAGTISGGTTVCAGSTLTLTDTLGGGSWSSSLTSVATVSAGIVTGVGPGTVTISYAVTNSCGTAYAIHTMTVLPTPVAIAGSASVCVGSVITLTDGTSGGTWSSSTTTVATIGAGTGIATGVAAGTTTITYALTSGCSARKNLTVNVAPVAGTISGGSSVCAGSTLTLTDTLGGGSWSSSLTSVATVSSGRVTGVGPGTVTISYAVTNACGTAYATHTITVNAAPNAGTISGGASVCLGSTLTLTDSVGGGSWSSSLTSVATISAGIVTGVAPGTVTISYVVTNSCGTANAIHTITVNAAPVAGTISGGSSVCAGSTLTLTDTLGGGSWSSSLTSIATVSSGRVTGVGPGTVTISYAVTNACGTAYAIHTMTVNAAPNAGTISGGTSVCLGSTLTLTDSVGGGSWSSSLTSVATVSSGIVTGISSGTATISYAVTNACGTAFATHAITVNPIPTISLPSGVGIYLGYSATLTATGGTTYTWSPPATLSSTVGATVIASPTITTTYTVTGTTAGCSSSAVETVTVTLRPCATPTTTPTTGITTTTAVINWIAVTGATEYLVSYKTSVGSTWINLLSTGTSQSLTGLTPGTAYNYKLRTICGAIDSSSTSSVGTFTTMIACGTPTSISSTGVTTTTAVINWSSVTGATSYILAYKISSASTWSTLLVTGTTHTLTGLTAATIYEYELRSVCGAGDSSGYTAYSTFTTLGGMPACSVPTGLTSVIGGSIVTLSWTAVPGATGYQVNYQLVTHGTPTYAYTTTYAIAITGLTLSSSYEYKVRSICGAGDTSSASPYTTFRVVTDGIASSNPSQGGAVSIYPNPTQDKFTISYQMYEVAPLTIMISNTLGQTVGILNDNEMQEEGTHNISFTPPASGLYIVRMLIGNSVYTEKLVKY